eukprot:scaffold5480_cov33-Attheya_sp.AAC.1
MVGSVKGKETGSKTNNRKAHNSSLWFATCICTSSSSLLRDEISSLIFIPFRHDMAAVEGDRNLSSSYDIPY